MRSESNSCKKSPPGVIKRVKHRTATLGSGSVLLCLLFLTFCVGAGGQTFTPADIDRLTKSETIPNVHLRQALGARARADAGDAVLSATQGIGANSLANTLESVKSTFDRAKQQYDIASYILKANDYLVKTAILGGLSASGAGAPVAPIVGAAMNLTLGYVEKAFDESAQEKLRRLLKTHLDDVEKTSEPQFQHLLTITDPKQFIQELTNDSGALFGSSLDQLPQNVQDEVNEFTLKETSKIMQNGFAWVAQTVSLQQSEIDQNRTDIAGVAQAFNQFTDQMTGQVAMLQQEQEELKDSVGDLQDSVTEDHDQLATVTEFLYSKLSPNERLAAINAGLLDGNLPQDQIDLLKSEAQMEENSRTLQETAKTYLDGAGNLVKIAQNLGVSPSILKPAQDIVAAGQTVFSAVSDFASGNYLGGLASVTSLFGIGGPDVNELRFQEILNRLGVIDQKLDNLGQKIDVVLKGEQQILDLQRQTYQAIASISQQISASHQEEMQALTTIETRIVSLNNTLLNLATRDFSACNTLIAPDDVTKPILDTRAKLYPSEKAIAKLFLDSSQSFSECFGHFRHTIQFDPQSQVPLFDPTFFPLTVYRTQPAMPQDQLASLDAIDAFVQDIYSNALQILNSVPGLGLPIDQRVASLFVPVQSTDALRSKMLSTLQIANARGFNSSQLSSLIKVPLSVPEVLSHGRSATNIHFYYLFFDAFDRPRPWQELISASDIRTTGKGVLEDTRLLVDTAIAQQILISGDVLLPLTADVLDHWASSYSAAGDLHCFVQHEADLPQACRDTFSPRQLELILAGITDSKRKTVYDGTLKLLSSNDIFARNYVRYRLRADVFGSNGSALSYAAALAQSDGTMLQSVAGAQWSFQRLSNNSWAAVIAGTSIPLPSATELSDGSFVFPAAVSDLLTIRDRVSEELGTYVSVPVGSDGNGQRANSLILAAAPAKFSR